MRAWTVDADDIRVAEDFDEALLSLADRAALRRGADAPERQ
jgi:hypothetical protein